MKTFMRILALMLAAILSLSLLVACGDDKDEDDEKSMKKIEKAIEKLDEDEYEYDEMGDLMTMGVIGYFEEDHGVEFNAGIKEAYAIYGESGAAYVIEFEKSADAKSVNSAVKADLDQVMEDLFDDYMDEDTSCAVKRSEKIVIFGDKDIIKEIW